jgi:hypothetical protein
MVVLEICTLGFRIYHLLHGEFFIPAVAVAIEIGLGILHYAGMSFERRLHHNINSRIRQLDDECRDKEDDLPGVAAAFNLRVGRWYQRIRRGHFWHEPPHTFIHLCL